MQGKLSRTEMKNVMAGNGGSYCSHNASWSYYNCGLSAAEAQSQASYYAQNNGAGNNGYWCCSSC